MKVINADHKSHALLIIAFSVPSDRKRHSKAHEVFIHLENKAIPFDGNKSSS